MGHLRDNGFEVTLIEVDDIVAVQGGVWSRTRVQRVSLAQVGDYMVEGHVPADLIMRFLEKDKGLAGITVPGMVRRSTGDGGSEPVPYDVLDVRQGWQ